MATMQHKLCISLLLFLTLTGCLMQLNAVSGLASKSREQDVREIELLQQELLSPKGQQMRPDEVFSKLERIHQLFASLDERNELSLEDEVEKKTYDASFEAWNATPNKCTYNDITGLEHLKVRGNFHAKSNINAYLKECMRKQIAVCAPMLEGRITSGIQANISHTDMTKLNTLVEFVAGKPGDSRPPFDRIKSDSYPPAILKFMKTFDSELSKNVFRGAKGDGEMAEERFKDIYRRLVTQLLDTCVKAAPESHVYGLITQLEPTLKPTSSLENWLYIERVCTEIRFEYLHELHIFDLLKDKSRKERVMGKLKGLVGGGTN